MRPRKSADEAESSGREIKLQEKNRNLIKQQFYQALF